MASAKSADTKAEDREIAQKCPLEPDDGTNTWVHRAARRIPCLGIIFALITSVLAATAGLIVKVTHSVHSVQICVFRAMIQLIFYTIMIQTRGIRVRPARGEYLPVAGRACLCGLAITASYFALRLISLGDSTVIRLSLPVWTLIIGYFVLGESCSLLKISAVLVSLSGVVLITKPDDCLRLLDMIYASLLEPQVGGAPTRPLATTNNQTTLNQGNEAGANSSLPPLTATWNNQAIGCSLTLMCSIALALSFVCLRLSKRTPVETIVFWVSLCQILCGSCLLTYINQWSLPGSWLDCLLILLAGLCGILSQWFCSYALKIEESGVIALARTFDIEIAFIYSALLHETIEATSIVGAVLVSYGTLAVAVPKLIESRRASKLKQNQSAPTSTTNTHSLEPPPPPLEPPGSIEVKPKQ